MNGAEVNGGQVDVFEGGNDVLLHAIANPAVFEQQCTSTADVKRAFALRKFTTSGSSSMTFYGGKGKFGMGTPDQCFVRCGKELCYVKTSLSTRPEAEVTRLVADADHPTAAELATLDSNIKAYGSSAIFGPLFSDFQRARPALAGANDTVVAHVDETINGTGGTRFSLLRFLRKIR